MVDFGLLIHHEQLSPGSTAKRPIQPFISVRTVRLNLSTYKYEPSILLGQDLSRRLSR